MEYVRTRQSYNAHTTTKMAETTRYLAMEKLKGRENYHTWAVSMRAYLQLEDLWETIVAPENGQVSTDAKKATRAMAKITLAIEPLLYTHLDDTTTAKAM